MLKENKTNEKPLRSFKLFLIYRRRFVPIPFDFDFSTANRNLTIF